MPAILMQQTILIFRNLKQKKFEKQNFCTVLIPIVLYAFNYYQRILLYKSLLLQKSYAN